MKANKLLLVSLRLSFLHFLPQILPLIKAEDITKHPARLQWFNIKKGNRDGGELLAAAELLLVSSPVIHEDYTHRVSLLLSCLWSKLVDQKFQSRFQTNEF